MKIDFNDQSHIHHITPMKTFLKVAFALFALTFLTIIAHQFKEHLGMFAAPIAFLIALVKAFLVMAWFMHLKYDAPLNRIIFGLGFFFLGLLFIISATDIFTRVKEVSTL